MRARSLHNIIYLDDLCCPDCGSKDLLFNGTHVDGWYAICNECSWELEVDPSLDSLSSLLNDLVEALKKSKVGRVELNKKAVILGEDIIKKRLSEVSEGK